MAELLLFEVDVVVVGGVNELNDAGGLDGRAEILFKLSVLGVVLEEIVVEGVNGGWDWVGVMNAFN